MTFVTCKNWQGFDIWDFGGSIIGLLFFLNRFFRPGEDSAMFSGLLISFSTHCQISMADSSESKLNPIIFRWSVDEECLCLIMWFLIDVYLMTYQMKDTLYEMLDQLICNWTNCQLYLSIMRNMFHVQLIQKLLLVSNENVLILYHTIKLEFLCTQDANLSYVFLHISLQVKNWQIPAKDEYVNISFNYLWE